MSHTQALWTPFDESIDNTLDTTKAKYRQKSLARILDGFQTGCLKDVREWETLLINGHCRTDSMYLSSKYGEEGQRISVNEMAWRIVEGGLPRDHIIIRILACEGTNFAQYLARALGQGVDLAWGRSTQGRHYKADRATSYPNIAVAGYKYKIFSNPGSRTLVWSDSQGYPQANTSNSGHVVWYDANGNVTAKPAIPSVEDCAAILEEMAQAIT